MSYAGAEDTSIRNVGTYVCNYSHPIRHWVQEGVSPRNNSNRIRRLVNTSNERARLKKLDMKIGSRNSLENAKMTAGSKENADNTTVSDIFVKLKSNGSGDSIICYAVSKSIEQSFRIDQGTCKGKIRTPYKCMHLC